MQREREDWLWENRKMLNDESKRLRDKELMLKDGIKKCRETLLEVAKMLKQLEEMK